ncbi:MAG: hypothetical protein HeimC2_27500 [Candidatus Heimdallarchaeota archaeon LC_2]|nr:MAG: hypothetical protein HeimC2_27500 [Candidatus Heimdallarchaeota archaeon LC_2]
MKEKQSLETELHQYTEEILILEVKIEVFTEKIEAFSEIIREKKIKKNELFSERDELIEKKRGLQSEKFEVELASEKDRISVNINNLSEKIGEVIEKSKALSVEIQAIYDESQIEYKNKTKSIDELKLLQKESNQKILSYKRKIAEADNDLNILRTKMNGIQEKLNENK